MRRPMVAITWGRDLVRRSANPGENALKYQDLLVRAGMTPVLITPGVSTSVLSRVDGLLVPGGPDIAPRIYGQESTDELGDVDPELDQLELDAVRSGHARQMPMLGICRGQQLINVALGGTLHQHISHPQWGDDPAQAAHGVQILPGTHLHRLLGVGTARVNSGHHQAIHSVAPDFVACAHSTDGWVEAIEAQSLRAMAVQWHPEEMPDAPTTHRLMDGFRQWMS